ncbi:MAG TPA: hypothetical protein VD905_05715 [Flavobacteriales bacterium]|nr:hypothetical protein [Flavobacteriales bacterium]
MLFNMGYAIIPISFYSGITMQSNKILAVDLIKKSWQDGNSTVGGLNNSVERLCGKGTIRPYIFSDLVFTYTPKRDS